MKCEPITERKTILYPGILFLSQQVSASPGLNKNKNFSLKSYHVIKSQPIDEIKTDLGFRLKW